MNETLAGVQSVWNTLLHTPLLARFAPKVTGARMLGAVVIVALGWWGHRAVQRLIARLAARHPTWPVERVRLIQRLLSSGIIGGTGLTALRMAGFELEALDLVWQLFNAPIFVLAGTEVSVFTVVTVVGVVYAGFRISELLQHGVLRWARARERVDEGSVGTVQRLLHYMVVGLSIVVGLQTIGINLDALLATGAVFAVGFGLAMQSIVQNFVSGIILLVEQSIRPGDVVEVEGRMVRVEEMAVRSTIVESLDGDRHIVPNSLLVQSAVRNLTMHRRPVRVHTRVGVAYHIDPDAVVEVLTRAVSTLPNRLPEEPPVVLFDAFGDSALEFDVFVWIQEPWHLPTARAQLNHRIWRALSEHNMPIPFPQRTIHMAQGAPPRPD